MKVKEHVGLFVGMIVWISKPKYVCDGTNTVG